MTMFPDIVGSQHGGYEPLMTVSTQRVGRGRIYCKTILPRFAVSLGWDALTAAEAKQIDDLVTSVAGGALTFTWVDWFAMPWSDVTIVGQNGSADTSFAIPGKESTEHTFYNASGTLAGTVTAGGWADGRDMVTFASAPTGAVWMDATMRRSFDVTFQNDEQPMSVLLDNGYYAFATRLVTSK